MTSSTPDPDPQPVQQAPQQPAQQWAWVRPVDQVQWVETPQLEYHQLLRGAPRYRGWKPLLALILGILYYLTLSVVFGLIVMVPYFLLTGAPLSEDSLMELAIPDTQNPASLIMTLGSVSLMIPAAILAMLSVGLSPAKRLWSVALRIRWRWIGRTVLPAVFALAVMYALSIVLVLVFDGLLASGVDEEMEIAQPAGYDPQAALLSMLLVLLLVPLQATAEEFVYRGMFMQTLGAWLGGVRGASAVARFLRGPWLPILVPALIFGFSHIYDIWGFLQVTLLAVAMGWISWRTGGIEAAISLHVVNNVVAFGFLAMAFGGETGQTAEGGWVGTVVAAVCGYAVFVWWVDRDFRRRDGRRTRIDYVEARVPVAPATPVDPTTQAPQAPTAGPTDSVAQ